MRVLKNIRIHVNYECYMGNFVSFTLLYYYLLFIY